MAQNKLFFTLVLLALVIFSQGFQSIEGRYLKPGEGFQNLSKKDDGEKVVHGGNSTTNAAKYVSPPSEAVGATAGVAPPPGRDVNDFRPTAPGHSPGVGHSIHN